MLVSARLLPLFPYVFVVVALTDPSVYVPKPHPPPVTQVNVLLGWHLLDQGDELNWIEMYLGDASIREITAS